MSLFLAAVKLGLNIFCLLFKDLLRETKKVFLVIVFVFLATSFNDEIKTLPLQARGQMLQPNKLYTCSNTFSGGGGGGGTSHLCGLLSVLLSYRNVRPQISTCVICSYRFY